MSVDLVATLPRPVTLAAVVNTACATLAELLALGAPPELRVINFALNERGAAIQPGWQLAAAELHDVALGVPGAEVFVQVTVGSRDAVWLMDGEFHPDGDGGMVLSVSPSRTCVGVALATGITLAAALAADGDFIDDEMGMLRPPVRDPRLVLARTRLSTPALDLAPASERYLRQFTHLGGWPDAVAID